MRSPAFRLGLSFAVPCLVATAVLSTRSVAQPSSLTTSPQPGLDAGQGQAPADDGRALADALFRRDEAMFRALLERGANPSAMVVDRMSGTKTPLIAHASRTSTPNLKLILLLLDHGAEVDATTQGGPWNGYTALIHAAGEGQLELVRALLKHGAKPNYVVPDNGHTALMSGAGFPAVVDVLLEGGAKIEVADRSGRTPAIFAGLTGCQQAVDHLKKRGADLERKDMHGKNARDYLNGFGKDSIATGICNTR